MPSAMDILARFYEEERKYMAAPPDQRDFNSGWGSVVSDSFKLIQSPDLPWGGTYHGHAGFLQWSEQMAAHFDTVDVMDPRLFEAEDEVVILSTLRLRVRKTGEELQFPLAQRMKMDLEKGVISEIQPFYWNVKGLNEALSQQ